MLKKIISLYHDFPTNSFSIRNISREIKMSYSHTNVQVNKLMREGILLVEGKGPSLICSLNFNNPLVKNYLSEISMLEHNSLLSRSNAKIKGVFRELDRRLPEITKYNLYSLILFGSYAKKKERQKSDIDLMAIIPSKEKYDESITNECHSINMRYAVNINVLTLEPEMYLRMLGEPGENVGKQVVRDKVILYGAEKFWELTLKGVK